MKNKINYPLIALIFLLLYGCTKNTLPYNNQPVSDDSLNIPEYNTGIDTFKISLDGKDHAYPVRADLISDFTKFKKFIQKFNGKSLSYDITYEKDITGDNRYERINSTIKKANDNWMVINKIYLNYKAVWNDTVFIDDAYCDSQWGEDSIYYKLKPYSSFYWGVLKCNDFLLKEKGAKNFADQPVTINLHRAYLQQKHIKPGNINVELKKFKRYLNNFSGYVISEQKAFNNNLYVWYEPDKKFVNIYTGE